MTNDDGFEARLTRLAKVRRELNVDAGLIDQRKRGGRVGTGVLPMRRIRIMAVDPAPKLHGPAYGDRSEQVSCGLQRLPSIALLARILTDLVAALLFANSEVGSQLRRRLVL